MPSNESKSGTVRSRNHEDEIRLAQNPALSTQIEEVSLLQSTQENHKSNPLNQINSPEQLEIDHVGRKYYKYGSTKKETQRDTHRAATVCHVSKQLP
uniref:Uncharacterized protein n=1 Tax=Caenorhabditis japonica TaxID=281687 RepID=A0A8R1IGD2_CAEJA